MVALRSASASVEDGQVSERSPATLASVKLRFSFRNQSADATAGLSLDQRRVRFWESILAGRLGDHPIEEAMLLSLESKVERFFGSALKERVPGTDVLAPMLSFAELGVVAEREQKRIVLRHNLATQLNFFAKIDSYGSMTLDLTVGTVERLAQIFDHNFDYFVAFLGSYAPLALVDSISWQGWLPRDQESFVKANLVATVQPTSTFLEAFAAAGRQPSVPNSSTSAQMTSAQKAQWLWVASNTSLIVPVLMALAVLLFGGRWLLDAQKGRAEIDKSLVGAQQEFIDQQREYIKQIRQDTAKRASKVTSTTPGADGGQH